MLNKNKQRELAYVVYIDDLKPIEGKDRVECAVVNGWTVMVRKTEFQKGDPAIYFEIDSKTLETKQFEFLAPKKYRIKTQKYGTFYSQGLLMPAADFGWTIEDGGIKDDKGVIHKPNEESAFLTEQLGVTYYDPMDNERKREHKSVKEYKKVFKKLKRHFPFKQMLRTNWGRKLLFAIFGIKKKKKKWPLFMPHSDQERVQNMTWILNNKTPWIATCKIDGCSSGYAVERGKFGKLKYYVCSRNVVLNRDSKAYYDFNVWYENYDKYKIKDFLTAFIKETGANWVYLQGESFGSGIQKRDYGMKDGEHDFRAFELCTSKRVRYTYTEMKQILDCYDIPTVPIINDNYILPDTVDELITFAHGTSVIDGGPREGIVFQNIEDPTISFKVVDPEFLIKYHGG